MLFIALTSISPWGITHLWYLWVMTLVLALFNTIHAISGYLYGGSKLPKRIYEIRVEGLLGDNLMSRFEGLTINQLDCGQTQLIGLMDQAMLRGILTRISDLGMNLVSVQLLENDKEER